MQAQKVRKIATKRMMKNYNLLIITNTVLLLFLQEIIISALPAIRKIVISHMGDVDRMIICDISLNISDEVYSLMPEFPADYIAESLNDLQSIQRIGHVVVEKEDDRDGTGVVTFTIIFLTNFGTTESDIPEIIVSSIPFSCGNASQTVTIEVVQQLTIPESFKVGFNDSFRVPRFTSDLLLSASSEELGNEISNLFAWQCETTPLQGSIVYNATYEESGGDNTTSFCGHYSAKNPVTIWQAGGNSDIKVSRNGYVSYFIDSKLSPKVMVFVFKYDAPLHKPFPLLQHISPYKRSISPTNAAL